MGEVVSNVPREKRSGITMKKDVRRAADDVDGKQYNVSKEFYAALENRVSTQIRLACKRASENGRKTIMPYDL